MKKILIVNNNMNIGGVQKSLYNLLWAIHGQYDVTLCLFCAKGDYIDKLPPTVRIVECRGLCRYLGISQGECHGIHKWIRGGLVVATRVFGRNVIMKLVLAGEKKLPGHFDCAIAFLHNGKIKNFYGGVQDFVLGNVNANRKVAFLHCDYSGCGADHPANNRLIAGFDKIAACSEGCRHAFESVMPELKEKCVTIRNFHRFDEIRTMAAQEPVIYEGDFPHVVMVSRLSHEKGIERAIEAVAEAARQGITMMLHIVGGGPVESMLRERAQSLRISDRVVFHGQKSNPYRYMANADLFLLTSFHEAAPMAIAEAVSLCIPVLTTRTTSSEEMVIETCAGWVCDNDQCSLNDTLRKLLANPAQLKDKKNSMRMLRASNDVAQAQFSQLIEDSNE